MVKDTILYDLLNVNINASDNELKKSYRKLSVKWHPDKNPDNKDEATAKFQKISEAYSILSDKEKRKMYDQIGIDILKNGSGGMNMDPSQIFEEFFSNFGGGSPFGGSSPFGSSFFGGDMFGNKRQNREEQENCVIEKEINLEDIYNEKTINIQYTCKQFCKQCNGTGDKSKKLNKCSTCNGQGKRVVIKKMGPMIQQFVTDCNECDGSGELIKNKCNVCNGKKYIFKEKNIELPLKNGLNTGNKIQLPEKGHNFKSGKTDLIILVKQKPHSRFKRKNNDLILNLNITLYQSLFGLSKIIKHLDNTNLHINYKKLIKDNDTYIIKNEGMNILNNSGKGNLIIKFKLNYPNLNKLEENEKVVFQKLLIKMNLEEYQEENNIKNLKNLKSVNLNNYNENNDTSSEEYHKKYNQHNYQQMPEEEPGCVQQ